MTEMTTYSKKEEKKLGRVPENPELFDFTIDSTLEIAAANGQISAVRKNKASEEGRALNEAAEDEFGEVCYKDSLPDEDSELLNMQNDVLKHIVNLTCLFLDEIDETIQEESKLVVDPADMSDAPIPITSLALTKLEREKINQLFSIPISVNVKQFSFERLAQMQQQLGGRLFDVITMDPPWVLSTAAPVRGVATSYDTLTDKDILEQLPFDTLQKNGFLFIWVINNKYRLALQLFKKYSYKLVDELVWVKQTVNGKIARGHGYYLQHAKETCLIGYKGDLSDKIKGQVHCDVIFSQRKG